MLPVLFLLFYLLKPQDGLGCFLNFYLAITPHANVLLDSILLELIPCSSELNIKFCMSEWVHDIDGEFINKGSSQYRLLVRFLKLIHEKLKIHFLWIAQNIYPCISVCPWPLLPLDWLRFIVAKSRKTASLIAHAPLLDTLVGRIKDEAKLWARAGATGLRTVLPTTWDVD